MERTFDIEDLVERSGFATVLEEQPEYDPLFPVGHRPIIEVTTSPFIDVDSAQYSGLGQFLYLSEKGQYDWLDNALAKIDQICSGADKVYSELALRQASHISSSEPRIYNAPEGGIVIETRAKSGILTLLIENPIGLIVRSANDFQINAQFNITSHSINELLVRYVHELKLIRLPLES